MTTVADILDALTFVGVGMDADDVVDELGLYRCGVPIGGSSVCNLPHESGVHLPLTECPLYGDPSHRDDEHHVFVSKEDRLAERLGALEKRDAEGWGVVVTSVRTEMYPPTNPAVLLKTAREAYLAHDTRGMLVVLGWLLVVVSRNSLDDLTVGEKVNEAGHALHSTFSQEV